ncbi:MAG: PilZ domain-containing protein [Roseburia sp.]|nr:PilZ domain-containing protein [Roseburia sp.]MCM1097242.1 PilZ domain-containing protein [Ruminococcus flavefaciens]
MAEKRKNKRTEMESRLIMKRLDGGNEAGKEALISICDVSKSGIGFECKEPLQIGEIYEAYLTIWTKEVLHSFLQIVRIELKKGIYYYGASFVGMPELDAGRIETYQTITGMEP